MPWRYGSAMIAPQHPTDFRQLSVAERIVLVEEIWDSIASDSADLRGTADDEAYVAGRLREISRDREVEVPWDEVKKRARTIRD